MMLPFTLKNKRRKTNLKFDLLKVGTILDPRKSAVLVFEEKPEKYFFSSCFGFDSALKKIDAPMFFWSEFLRMHKKSYRYWPSKKPFWPFLRIIMVFFCEKKFRKNCSSYFSFVLALKTILRTNNILISTLFF